MRTVHPALLSYYPLWLVPRIAGGGRKKREKAAKTAEDRARQQEESQQLLNQFLAQLVPGSQEFNDLQTRGLELVRRTGEPGDQAEEIRQLASQLVSQQQARIARGEPTTALEARTQAAFTGLRQQAALTPEEEDLFRVQRGEAPVTPLGRELQARILEAPRAGMEPPGVEGAIPGFAGMEDLARVLRGESTTTPLGTVAQEMLGIAQEDPTSLFEQELTLLQDRINREAQARGLASSGIPLEQLGRAGVDLAIAQAERRENIRRTRQADVLDLLTRVQSDLLTREQLGQQRTQLGLQRTQLGAQREQQELENLLALFGTGQTLRGRQLGVEEAATNLQLGRESRLTDLLAAQTGRGTENLLELLAARTTRAESLRDVASALREAERQRTASFFAPPDLAPASPVRPPTVGGFPAPSPTFSSLAPVRGRTPVGSDVESLLATTRAPASVGGVSPNLGASLSRERGQEDAIDTLIRHLQQGR